MKRKIVKYVVSVIFALLWVVFVPNADAVSVPSNPEQAFELLHELGSFQHIEENFGGLSEDGKYMLEQGIATYDAYAEEYGSSYLIDSSNMLLGPEAWSEINTLTGEYSVGLATVSDTSAASAAIGGEIGAFATAAAWIQPLALIPLAGSLGYEDITTGTNFVTSALIGPEQDKGAVSSVGASKFQWIYVPSTTFGKATFGRGNCTGTFYVPGCVYQANIEDGSPLPTSGYHSILGYFGNIGGLEPTLSGATYVLLVEAEQNPGEPHWWVGSSSEVNSKGEYQACIVDTACQTLAGFPDVVEGKHIWGRVATTQHVSLAIPANSYCCEQDPNNVWLYSAGRVENRMTKSAPRKRTKAEVEALSSGGHTLHTQTPTFPKTVPELESSLKKVEQGSEEHRYKHAFEAFCHWTNSCTNKTAAIPETETAPASPEKPEETVPALPGLITIPECKPGVTGLECGVELEELGFSPVTVKSVNFRGADITKAPLTWLSLKPAAGTQVEPGSPVEVEQNPEKLPVEIPAPSKAGETGTEYQKELETAGFTKTSLHTLPETSIDPSVGPDGFSYSVPAVHSLSPTLEDPVDVEQNPATAPVVPEGGGVSGPTLPGFKFPNFGVLCKGFPFGVPCWLAKTIESWSASPSAPEWGFEDLVIRGHHITGKFQLSHFEGLMEVFRPVMLLFATIGLVLLFYNFAKGGSPASGANSENTSISEGSGTLPDDKWADMYH